MKYPHFLYTLKRTCIVTVITIGMICTTVHSTSALTNDSTIVVDESADAAEIEGPVSETVPPMDETTSELSSDTDTEAADPSLDSPDTPDTEASDGEESGTEISDSEIPAAEEPATDPAESEDPAGENPDTEGSDTDASDTDASDNDASDNDTSDTEIADTDASEIDDSDISEPDTEEPAAGNDDKEAANTSPQESVTVNSEATIKDRSAGAIYIRTSYNPSERFIAIEDRIKYNVALPIDNIPSFITQEMIIGALKCQDETGYPASVTIAQIIQESGFGKYGPGGNEYQGLSYLAFEYCNLFGIKGTGTAGSVDMRTGEQTPDGQSYMTTASFRVYNTYTECIEDRTKILKEVYSDLIKGVTDANTFAMRIGSRWATSLEYSRSLISQMEQYDLYRLDRMTLRDFSKMIGQFADPCPGAYRTSDFGYRTFDNKFHKGIDLGTNGAEIPTYAAESGTVIVAGWNNSAGNWVIIDHGNGLVTKYMHHSHVFVKEGQKVIKGQQIGLTGTTGNSTGIHLHFQVEENGVAVDPTPYLTKIQDNAAK